jgi:hypothetical protein
MAINIDDVMQYLAREGYENFSKYDDTQIIVNNRGEIDFQDGLATIYSRITPRETKGPGDRKPCSHINELMLVVKANWTRKEPK